MLNILFIFTAIATASAPANANASCLALAKDNPGYIQSIFFVWDGPVQIHESRNVSEFYIHLKSDSDSDYVAERDLSVVSRYLYEDHSF